MVKSNCLALVLLVLLAATSQADEPEPLEHFRVAVGSEDAVAALAALRTKEMAGVFAEPDHALTTCRLVHRHVVGLAEAARNDEAAKKAVEALIRTVRTSSEALLEENQFNAALQLATAFALAADGRMRRVLGHDADPRMWQTSAMIALQSASLYPTGVMGLVDQAEAFAGEAAPPGDHATRVAWFAQAIESSRDEGNDEPRIFDRSLLAAGQARAALDGGERKTAKAAFETAFAEIEAISEDSRVFGIASALYNHLVHFARDAVRSKRELRVTATRTSPRMLAFDVPAGWEHGGAHGLTYRAACERGPSLVAVTFNRYERDKLHALSSLTKFKAHGNDLEELAELGVIEMTEMLDSVAKVRKKGGRLSRRVGRTKGFEMTGRLDLRPVTNRRWYFEGDRHEYSFSVNVFRIGPEHPALEAELELLLDSIEEVALR